MRADVVADRDALLAPSAGTITRTGFAANVGICLRYLAAWLDGQGCVPIHHLMEDAATAEISRAQLWQWLHHDGVVFDDGTPVDVATFDATLADTRHELAATTMPGQSKVDAAADLLDELTRAPVLAGFLTLAAYPSLVDQGRGLRAER